MNVFNFSDIQIAFVKGIKRRGEILGHEIPELEAVYHVIDPKIEICNTCSGSPIRAHDHRMVQIMEETLNVKLEKWQPEVKQSPEDILEMLGGMSNKAIQDHVREETGDKIFGNKETLTNRAYKLLK